MSEVKATAEKSNPWAMQLADARRLSQGLEPDDQEREHWQKTVDQTISDFISRLSKAPTFLPKNGDLLAQFDRKVGNCKDLGELITTVTQGISKAGLLTAGPGHLAFVPGGGLYLGALADHLASALNPFSADDFAAPIATHIHNQAIRWLCDLIGFGRDAYGDLTSGGSVATLTALHVARKAYQIKSHEIASLVIYVGEHTHHCFQKATEILFGDDINIRVVSSKDHAMDVQALRRAIISDRDAGLRPWMVVATAGSTNLGRVDPLAAISEVAQHFGLWFHVDAAYGGFFKMVPELASQFRGIEKADSVVLDPHKGLFLPYGSGAVLFRNGHLLHQNATGSYLQDRHEAAPEVRSPMDYSLELTRPFRALRLWLTLKFYGEEVLAAALREKRILAAYLAEELATLPHITLVTDPDLSILAFRFSPKGDHCDQGTKELLARINTHPEVFLSSTQIGGITVIRVAILSFRTHMETVEKLLQIIHIESDKIAAEMGVL